VTPRLELAARDQTAESHEEAPHPEKCRERQVAEVEHVDGAEREELHQLLALQGREERCDRRPVVRRRDRNDRPHAGRQPLHVERRRQPDPRRGEQAHVEASARVADQMERSAAARGRRVDHLGHPCGAIRQRGGGRRPDDMDAWLEPQRSEALREEPPDVPEVRELPQVFEAEEARHQVDVVGAVHAPSE